MNLRIGGENNAGSTVIDRPRRPNALDGECQLGERV